METRVEKLSDVVPASTGVLTARACTARTEDVPRLRVPDLDVRDRRDERAHLGRGDELLKKYAYQPDPLELPSESGIPVE